MSVGELAMTPKISLVAVCCSRGLFELLEQPDVLDGDDGLISESFKQFDLLVGEWTDFGAANEDGADCSSLAKQRC